MSSNVFKRLAISAESAFGTPAPAAGAQALRRVSSSLDVNPDFVKSNEIRTDFQEADGRVGVRKVSGNIDGELSPATYAMLFAASLKREFTALSLSGLTITIGGTPGAYTLTRSAGSWLTDGVKVADVVRLTAGGFNAANLNKNLWVTAATDTVLNVQVLNLSNLTTEGPITAATLKLAGKKTWIPASGHTDRSFSIEHWYSDAARNELFVGCKPTKISLGLQPNNMVTIKTEIVGQDIIGGSVAYFTNPTPITSTVTLSGISGVARLNAANTAAITGFSMEISSLQEGEAGLFSTVVTDFNPGTVSVTGQITLKFEAGTVGWRDVFVNGQEFPINVVLTADKSAGSDFIAFSLPRCKSTSNGVADKTVMTQTLGFKAYVNIYGGVALPTEYTTLSIQDSSV